MSHILIRFWVVMSLCAVDVEVFAGTSKEELFCVPACISAKISPDGQTIAYVGADDTGIANIFIQRRGDETTQSTQVTFFQSPQIIQFFWSAHSDKVLFLKDQNGTGQLHLHSVDIYSKHHVIYTEQFPRINGLC